MMFIRIEKVTPGLVLFLLLMVNCTDPDTNSTDTTMKTQTEHVAGLDTAKLKILSSKKIFFGHQSVGANLIGGIEDVLSQNQVAGFNIVETRGINDIGSDSYLAHAKVGANRYPDQKVDDFKAIIEELDSAKLDIAFLKFCYADFQENTNVEEVFNYYSNTMDYLEGEFPGTKFIHITVPVRTRDKGVKGTIKKLMGKDKNAKRMEYNKLMREKYSNESLFDLAYYESVTADNLKGTANRDITYLLEEYTHDGGHLNPVGANWIASHLLKLLCE